MRSIEVARLRVRCPGEAPGLRSPRAVVDSARGHQRTRLATWGRFWNVSASACHKQMGEPNLQTFDVALSVHRGERRTLECVDGRKTPVHPCTNPVAFCKGVYRRWGFRCTSVARAASPMFAITGVLLYGPGRYASTIHSSWAIKPLAEQRQHSAYLRLFQGLLKSLVDR
jgi:hypothetical protein